jgi:hypothetical protein
VHNTKAENFCYLNNTNTFHPKSPFSMLFFSVYTIGPTNIGRRYEFIYKFLLSGTTLIQKSALKQGFYNLQQFSLIMQPEEVLFHVVYP